MDQLVWRKSSFSGGGNGNCVEIAVEWTKSSYSSSAGNECIEAATDWVKSSYSTSGDNECVELAGTSRNLIHLRESDEPDTVLRVAPGIWSAFTRAVKAGEYDHAGRC